MIDLQSMQRSLRFDYTSILHAVSVGPLMHLNLHLVSVVGYLITAKQQAQSEGKHELHICICTYV